jgi:hypothetical protein
MDVYSLSVRDGMCAVRLARALSEVHKGEDGMSAGTESISSSSVPMEPHLLPTGYLPPRALPLFGITPPSNKQQIHGHKAII